MMNRETCSVPSFFRGAASELLLFKLFFYFLCIDRIGDVYCCMYIHTQQQYISYDSTCMYAIPTTPEGPGGEGVVRDLS